MIAISPRPSKKKATLRQLLRNPKQKERLEEENEDRAASRGGLWEWQRREYLAF